MGALSPEEMQYRYTTNAKCMIGELLVCPMCGSIQKEKTRAKI